MTHIVIMGPPGVGKGTQATRLAGELGLPHITTGQLLRDEIERGTEVGRNLAHTVSAGEFVSNALSFELLRARVRARDAQDGYILDGYPRTDTQADALDAMLERGGHSIDVVLLLEADDRTLLNRVAGRAAAGRTDDREEVVRHRLELYRSETAPIASRYEDRGILNRIDARGTPAEVTAAITNRLPSRAALR